MKLRFLATIFLITLICGGSLAYSHNSAKKLVWSEPARVIEIAAKSYRRAAILSLSKAAQQAQVNIHPSQTVTATRNNEALAVMAPVAGNLSDDMYAYIALPSDTECSTILFPDFYYIDISRPVTSGSLSATFTNRAGVEVLNIAATEMRVPTPLPALPTVDLFFKPNRLELIEWVPCSDDPDSHCANAVTLVAESSTCQ